MRLMWWPKRAFHKSNWRLKVAVVAAIIIFGSIRASATNYYVNSLDGNDANTGLSASSAWRTISRGNSVLVAGDTLLVMQGTYSGEAIAPASAGTADASRITYRAVGKVIISRSSISLPAYSSIMGFEIRTPTTNYAVTCGNWGKILDCRMVLGSGGVYMFGGTIERCVFAYFTSYALNVPANSCVVSHSTFFRNSFVALYAAGATDVRDCSFTENATAIAANNNLRTDHCNFYRNSSNFADAITASNAANSTNSFFEPLFIDTTAEIFHLRENSRLINAGSDGRQIGAYGIGIMRSSRGPLSWSGWTDGAGNAVGVVGSEIVINSVNQLALRDGITVGVARSDVIQLPDSATHLVSLDYSAIEALAGTAGQRSTIDQDGTTREPELRFRISSSPFASGDPSPAWTTVRRLDTLNASGRYIQVEYTFRRDGI